MGSSQLGQAWLPHERGCILPVLTWVALRQGGDEHTGKTPAIMCHFPTATPAPLQLRSLTRKAQRPGTVIGHRVVAYGSAPWLSVVGGAPLRSR